MYKYRSEMRKIILLILVLLPCAQLLAQGIASDLYQYNYSIVHPGFAGSEGQHRISLLANTVIYDDQFSERHVNGNAFFSYDTYFEKIASGISVMGSAQRLGPKTVTSTSLAYNYQFKINDHVTLIPAVRLRRYWYSLDLSFFRVIQPNDPLLTADQDVSEANWSTDFGLVVKVKKFSFGVMTQNFIHTNDKLEGISGSTGELDREYTAIAETSFTINKHLSSTHSVYIPVDDEDYRLDFNNTLLINDLFIAGISLEKSESDFFMKLNTGVKVKDRFQVVMLVYSGPKDEGPYQKFSGEVYLQFKF
jgi:type IX secretion system PorP/SprF family membrane protein